MEKITESSTMHPLIDCNFLQAANTGHIVEKRQKTLFNARMCDAGMIEINLESDVILTATENRGMVFHRFHPAGRGVDRKIKKLLSH